MQVEKLHEGSPQMNWVFEYPVFLGAPLTELFLLHMIILVRLRSLFVYYAIICTILT